MRIEMEYWSGIIDENYQWNGLGECFLIDSLKSKWLNDDEDDCD